jgi:osmoprotectant transport system permease protein
MKLWLRWLSILAFVTAWLGQPCVPSCAQELVVGSKRFTESYVLGEIARRLLENAGFQVEHKQGMGGTGIVWQALRTRQITAYPEYTGTISEEILKVKGRMDPTAMRAALARHGVGMTGELGFNNTYALVMRQDRAKQLGIRKISDLRNHPDLVIRPTPEFLKRQDGWEPLSDRYGLAMKDVAGVEHALGYTALTTGRIDVKDAYSTDAKIVENKLVVLEDDLGFFPQYRAVFLYRLEAPAKAVAALRRLEETLSDRRMTEINAVAERTKDYARAAAEYFQDPRGGAPKKGVTAAMAAAIGKNTRRHLELVGESLTIAIVVGILLGIVASRPGFLSQLILGASGVIQTVPSIALLMMLIPLMGIGTTTAIVALFLYSLLPIVRNTATGLQEIPPSIRESADALGLGPVAKLTKVFLPMASRTILAGIKTSAVINVGTATLAAFIGAGGLGDPIVSGLNLNDPHTVLQGAIPAAILALLVQFGFDLLDRVIIPRGLRLKPSTDR